MRLLDGHIIEFKHPGERLLLLVVIGYQLLLLISFFGGFDKLFIILTALSGVSLLLLPQIFWLNVFIFSLFVHVNPIGSHLLVEFAAYAFAGLFLARHLLDPTAKLNTGPLFIPIAILLLAMGISLIEPYDYAIGFKNYIRYLLMFGVYWALHNYFRTTYLIEAGIRYYLTYTMLASVTMVYGILAYGGSRKFGIGGIPFNELLAVAAIVALIYFLFSETKVKRWLLLCCYLFLAVILAQTRGVWLSTALTLIFVVVMLFVQRKSLGHGVVWFRLTALLIGTIFSIVIVVTIFPTVLDFISERLTQHRSSAAQLTSNSLFTRLLIWSTAWQTFWQNPINGIGIDLFPVASHLYYTIPSVLFVTFVEGLDPHLLFLTFLCETGIIGAVAFLVFLVWNLRIGYLNLKLAKTSNEKKLAIALWAVHFFVFVSSLYAGAWFYGQNGFQFMLFLAMNSALYIIRRSEYATS